VEEKKELATEKNAMQDNQVKDIPFVSIRNQQDVWQRFGFDEGCVKKLCRPKLNSLIDASEANTKTFVWGNTGTGKSHLMNAFAFLKFCQHSIDRSKPRVLWIPHLGTFADDPAEHLFEALVLAFFDSPDNLLELIRIGRDWGELNAFIRRHSIILVADNHNALDGIQIDKAKGTQCKNFIKQFPSADQLRRVIYCASANQHSVALAVGKQDGGIFKLAIFGGFLLEELKELTFAKYPNLKVTQKEYEEAKVPAEHDNEAMKDLYETVKRKAIQWEAVAVVVDGKQKVVEEGLMGVTGGVGLDVLGLEYGLLTEFSRRLTTAPDQADFAETLAEWKSKKAAKVKAHLKAFFANLEKSEKVADEITAAWQFLFNGACSLEGDLAPPELVDCAFFLPKEDRQETFDWCQLSPTSDVVTAVALELWLQHAAKAPSVSADWREPLKKLLSGRKVNPSVAGFIDELIALRILPHIKFSIKAAVLDLKFKAANEKSLPFGGRWDPKDLSSVHSDLQVLVEQAELKKECLQFDPELWNYAHADSIIVFGSPLTVVNLQATYQKPSNKKKASNTAKFFTTDQWKKFAFGDAAKWKKVILWISADSTLRKDLPLDILQVHMSFKEVFKLGEIPY